MLFQAAKRKLAFWILLSTFTFAIALLADPAFAQVSIPEGPAGKPAGSVIEDIKLDAAERQRVISGVISNLKEYYVYPETAQKMADALEGHQKHGDYDGVTNGDVFAAQIVAHLQAVSHDKHLRVDYSPMKMPPQQQGPDPSRIARMQKQMEHMNCGFEKAEILPSNIGYLKFNMFANPELCGAPWWQP